MGYSGIRIYSGIYSGYSAPRGRIAGMGIQVFPTENSFQTNAYSHYSNYSYFGLIPNERTLNDCEKNQFKIFYSLKLGGPQPKMAVGYQFMHV